tara:strand:- start:2166 stop:2438 length:273 start_codon:yes stop_codon:yes gene_type:complete
MTNNTQIQARYRQRMNEVMTSLDHMFNGPTRGADREVGIMLLIFPYGEQELGQERRTNYISNGADRRDMIILMKELIARFEGQPEITGRA